MAFFNTEQVSHTEVLQSAATNVMYKAIMVNLLTLKCGKSTVLVVLHI